MREGARTHIVMVPGFGGFDALGQIFYYAGVTFAFQDWKSAQPASSAAARTSLHYFDNLPTAGVRSRALALRTFLDERTFRCMFEPGDRIALVGHSTGGLDVRQLIVNIGATLPEKDFGPLRDVTRTALVENREIFDKIERLVFLSVPQRGTNIADFTRRARSAIANWLSLETAGLKHSHDLYAKGVASRIEPLLGLLDVKPQLFEAILDAFAETLEKKDLRTAADRYGAALSREAYGELLGWLENVRTDFFAIDDLATVPERGASPTPAHYDEALRAAEKAGWEAAGIRTLSYATVGKRPYGRDPGTNPSTLAELSRLWASLRPSPPTDVVYRILYGITAAGAFRAPQGLLVQHHGERRSIEPWENDGIVNTASMLWPDGEATRLVDGDHGDIIGHYVRTKPVKESEEARGRQNHSYDILASDSGFDQQRFADVWREIFEFCTGP